MVCWGFYLFMIRVSKFISSKAEKVRWKMHENIKVGRSNSNLLKSTLATCPFFFWIISKQEIRIAALKQRPQISEMIGKFIHAEKVKKLKQTKGER